MRHAIPGLRNDQPAHQYRLVNEAALVNASLPRDNFAAALFQLEHPATSDNLVDVLKWLNSRLSGSGDARLRRDFGRLAYWLYAPHKIRFRLPWKRDLLKEVLEMAELQGQTIWQRVEERAIAQGILIGKRALLRTMLDHRFAPPPLPDWVDTRVAAATEEDIALWSSRLAAPQVTLEQIFLS